MAGGARVAAGRGAARSFRAPSPARRFLGYLWGIIAHPAATIDALAAERGVAWAVAVAALGVAQVWGNMLLFAAFGYNWLGSLPLLADPTYVGWFGYLRVDAAQWLPIFAALMPILALYGLVVAPGVAQLLSKLWGGQGTFEQLVNALAFASVPALLLGWLSEWLTGVPLNLLSGQAYFYDAAMRGEYGPTVATLWTVYAAGIYTVGWTWQIILGTVAIRRVQRIPLWAAALTMLLGFALQLLISTSFVR